MPGKYKFPGRGEELCIGAGEDRHPLGLIDQESGEYEKALDCYDRALKGIEEYSQVFREGFSRLQSQGSREFHQTLNSKDAPYFSFAPKTNCPATFP